MIALTAQLRRLAISSSCSVSSRTVPRRGHATDGLGCWPTCSRQTWSTAPSAKVRCAGSKSPRLQRPLLAWRQSRAWRRRPCVHRPVSRSSSCAFPSTPDLFAVPSSGPCCFEQRQAAVRLSRRNLRPDSLARPTRRGSPCVSAVGVHSSWISMRLGCVPAYCVPTANSWLWWATASEALSERWVLGFERRAVSLATETSCRGYREISEYQESPSFHACSSTRGRPGTCCRTGKRTGQSMRQLRECEPRRNATWSP